MRSPIFCWFLLPAALAATEPVGLSLFFQNGQMAPLKLATVAPRYLDEVDLVVTTPPSPNDEGAQPITVSSEFGSLNWTGLVQVEEDWRQGVDGKLQRQRFFRNAAWMNSPSLFTAIPLNASGLPVGLPLVASTGLDSQRTVLDDGFIRRFVVRQIASGCPAVNNCTGASFVVQALVQWRAALRPQQRAVQIPAAATRLKLLWSENLSRPNTVALERVPPSSLPFGHGFQTTLTPLSAPGNGQFYLPGEAVSFRVNLLDGQGRRLHPVGSLPTYLDFVSGQVPSGIDYYNGFQLNPTLYYALKHREALFIYSLQGPTNKLKQAKTVLTPDLFFQPQVPVATPGADGYSGVIQTVPPAFVLFNPPAWGTPVSDVLTFTIPNDAEPGTYVFTVKARRNFGGERLARVVTAALQVGSTAVTSHSPIVGACGSCHTGNSDLTKLLHGTKDFATCYACHAPQAIEPDNPVDIRVHAVHSRSRRFDSNIQNCLQCHLTPPPGPARGILGTN